MDIKIIRSAKRLRTISARVVDDTLLVHAPVVLSERRLQKIVADFKLRFERKKLKDELERAQGLQEVAARLNVRYFGNALKVKAIEYATDQTSKFGCCNFRDGTIRISHRVGLMPKWVRDYVIIHEMAHLIEPNHGRAFWQIVNRYRLSERARGFLMAKGTAERGQATFL